ncbi:MAG: peptide chain release factor N(5)-glutamine methyltransferase [Clostridia bacterium]|nr:peptide chain release factor N(5)-glutamine methyltransferase [Clostridia bacterium]
MDGKIGGSCLKISELLYESINKLKEYNVQDARLQAKILMEYILKVDEQFLIVHGQEELTLQKQNEFKKGIHKLIEGVPIQYITNIQEFMKLKFYVDENVLIPQPDTEILVEEVVKKYRVNINDSFSKDIINNSEIEILDLCTGSGAIGISLEKYINKCKVTCTDISMKALQVAKLNAEKNLVHKNMEFILSDLFENLQGRKFDIIVSNPPYIKKDIINTLEKTVQNEPHLALDGGEDGLDFYKRISNDAYKFLKPDGEIFLEIGYNQKEDVIRLLENTNQYKNIKCIQDLAGNDRVVNAKM